MAPEASVIIDKFAKFLFFSGSNLNFYYKNYLNHLAAPIVFIHQIFFETRFVLSIVLLDWEVYFLICDVKKMCEQFFMTC